MIRTLRHRGLKRLYERGDQTRLRANQVERIALALADLDNADKPSDLDLPGYRLHRLKGDLKGCWSITVSGNWRIIFRFERGDAYNVDLVDYHQEEANTMAMKNPPHPGRSIKENCLDPLSLNVTEAAKVLGVARHTLSRVLNGHAAISPEMAIRLEKAGWSNAEFWLRRQTTYDLVQARRYEDRIKVKRYNPQPTA